MFEKINVWKNECLGYKTITCKINYQEIKQFGTLLTIFIKTNKSEIETEN